MKTLARVALVFAAIIALAAPAAAQQTMTTDPTSVDAAGEQTFTVTLDGFTADGFVLPCTGTGDDFSLVGPETCDFTNLTPFTAGDGVEVEVTYDVPDIGILIVAGDAAQTQSAFAFIPVGDAGELPNTGANTNMYLTVGLVLAAGAAALVVGGRRMQQA